MSSLQNDKAICVQISVLKEFVRIHRFALKNIFLKKTLLSFVVKKKKYTFAQIKRERDCAW